MKREESTLRQEFTVLLLLVGMVIWFSHEMIWTEKVPFFRDLGPYFYPVTFSLAQSFKSGELPLWNLHMAMGFPLLADFQSGAFYPPHLFYLLLPFWTAVRLLFPFHFLVSAVGSYLLWRQWSYPTYLAMIGAILFTLGGAIVSLTNLLNHFQTAVWLPWVIFAWERVLRSGSWKDFLILISVLLLQFLAGSPELFAMSMGLVFLDSLRMKSVESNLGYRKILFILLAANALVVALAMVQVLPTIELFLESRGREPVPYMESPLYSLHAFSLINLFVLDKEVNTSIGSGIHLFFLRDIPFLISHYLGAIALIGISLWLFYGPLREKALLLGLIAASLTLAMGSYTPVYPLLYHHLPFMSLFRFPEKFFFLTNAFLVFITVRGLRFLQSDDSSLRKPLLILSSVCFLFFLLYLFLRFDMAALSRFISRATYTPLLSTETLGKTSAALVNLERQMALTLGIFLLLFAWKKGKLQTNLFQALIVGMVFIDLQSAHKPYQYLLNPEFVYKSPTVLASPDTGPNRLFYYPGHSNLHPSYYSILRQPSFPEFQSLVFSTLLPNTGVFHGFDHMQEIDALRRWPYIVFLGVANHLAPDKLYRLLGALNVKYMISFRKLEGRGVSLVRHFPEHPSWLYRLDDVVPRAYVVSKTTEEKDALKTLRRLSSEQFNPLKEVILDQPLAIALRKNFQAQARIVQYTNHQVTIHASLNGSGVLILADSYYPGWRVYVNGEEKEILRANFFFRAVPLSEGEHLVEFRYQPRSFTIGLAISLITLCGIVICSILALTLQLINRHERHAI